MKIRRNALAYGMCGFSFSIMGSVYSFYYVNLFLNVYRISQTWFNISQSVYLIWNALNDPLFAYFQDHSKHRIFRQRRLSILYGAPLFSLTFLLPWFPWGNYEPDSWIIGVHLFVSLFLYDALFTFVGLATCALFAEMSREHEDRLRLIRYSQIASIFGSLSVFVCELLSDGLHEFRHFQILCLTIAILSWLSLRFTGLNAQTLYDEEVRDIETTDDVKGQEPTTNQSMWRVYWQIISQGNVFVLVVVNFCHEFQGTYGRNFLSIFAKELIPKEDLPDFTRKLLYGSVFILPQICVLLLSPVVRRFGAYRMYQFAFYIKILSSVTMYLIGPSHTWVLAVFFLVDMTSPTAMSRYLNLLMADCIDDDMQKYKRKSPLSSMFFAVNALIIKPSQSLAPIFIVHILNKNGYQEAIHGVNPDPSVVNQLHHVMFQVACIVPFVFGAIQLILWTRYTLRDSHVAVPKYCES